jgi:hypothetical protein
MTDSNLVIKEYWLIEPTRSAEENQLVCYRFEVDVIGNNVNIYNMDNRCIWKSISLDEARMKWGDFCCNKNHGDGSESKYVRWRRAEQIMDPEEVFNCFKDYGDLV